MADVGIVDPQFSQGFHLFVQGWLVVRVLMDVECGQVLD
jgi:hypothetical protein